MNNIKRLTALIVMAMCFVAIKAQTPNVNTPELEFVMQLRVTCGQAYGVGETPSGNRMIIPITGGTFAGPNIKGEVLNGGADYQLHHKGRSDLEAIYCIRTHDGVTIHIRNAGIINFTDGKPYFFTAPKFEAPEDSPYAWLNHAIFVCRPAAEGIPNGVVLNVWKVK